MEDAKQKAKICIPFVHRCIFMDDATIDERRYRRKDRHRLKFRQTITTTRQTDIANNTVTYSLFLHSRSMYITYMEESSFWGSSSQQEKAEGAIHI